MQRIYLALAFLPFSAGLLFAENRPVEGLRQSLALVETPDSMSYQLRLEPKGVYPSGSDKALRLSIDMQTTGSIATDRMSLRNSLTTGDGAHRWSWSENQEIRGTLASAINRSAALRASISDVDVARAGTFRAIAAFMPTLNGNITSVIASLGQNNSLSDQYSTGGLSLTVPLFAGGQNLNNFRSAKATERASRFALRTKIDTVVAEVLATHVEAEFAKTQVSIIEGSLSTLRRLRGSVSRRASAGLASQADIADIDASIAVSERQLEAARGSLAAANQALRLSTGKDVSSAQPDLKKLEKLFAGGRNALIASARSRSSIIGTAREQANAADYRKLASVGKFAPRIDLSGEYTRILDQNASNSIDPDRFTIQVRLRVPIVDLNTVAEVKEAHALAAAAGYRAQDAAHEIEKQITADWEGYMAKKRQLQASAKEIESVNRSLASRQKQFEAGLINADSVATQAQKAADARLSQAQLQAELKVTIVNLASAAGIL